MQSLSKPFSQACENNKQPILAILREAFATRHCVLEVATGTGQHACHFAANLPHLHWLPTDLAVNLPGISLWLEEAQLDNVSAPQLLDVAELPWSPKAPAPIDAVFSANSLHIMGKPLVECFFKGVGQLLTAGGVLCVYGPFNYDGQYTSPSNASFDQWLAQQNPQSAIRDFEWISELARQQGLEVVDDHAMPANNRLLVFEKGV